MEILYVVIASIIGYLCGSILTASIIARAKGVNLRQFGSGNVGGTNAGRALGKKYGLLVIFLDASKVYLPMMVCALVGKKIFDDQFMITLAFLCCGLAGNIGHSFSIFARFKGGKSVSTTLGFVTALNPLMTLVVAVIFTITLFITKIVSLTSIISLTATFLVMLIPFFQLHGLPWGLHYYHIIPTFVGVNALLAISRHHSNIGRLLKGTERKISWLSRKKK